MTVTITPEDVRNALAIYGIETDLTDAQLQTLIDIIIAELSELINVPIGPVTKEYTAFDFKDKRLFLQFYPVQNITSFKIAGEDITEYRMKKNEGFILLNDIVRGDVEIVYEYGLILDEHLKHLILDMIVFKLKYGIDGPWNSVTEGDVSVSYSGYGLHDSIQKRIDNLRNNYAGRLRIL